MRIVSRKMRMIMTLTLTFIMFLLSLPACSQPYPISTSLFLSEPPLLGKSVEVTLTFSIAQGYRGDAKDVTARIMLPEHFEKVSGDLEWQGDMVKGQTYTIRATVKAVKVGYYVIWGRVFGGAPRGGSAHDIYVGIFEDTTRIYEIGQLPRQVHFEEPMQTPIQGTQ